MKIEKVTIKNFKGIKELDTEINGRNVYLKGGNGTGKSSFIDSIWFGLTGKKAPTQQTHNGAKRGLIEIDLGDFIARTKIKNGKPNEFEIENKEYSKESERFISAPRTYLNQRIGVIDFDINDFFSMTDGEKLKYLAKILDADFSNLDVQIEDLMESRKFDKKKLAELNTKVQYYSEEDAEKDLVDVVKLSQEISAIESDANTIERVKDGIKTREESIQSKKDRILELQNEITVKEKEVEEANIWINENPIDEEVLAQKKKQLETANEDNKKINEAKEARETDKAVEEITLQISEADKDIENLRAEKSKKIGEVLKVPGLTYNVDEEIFYYKGLPFEKEQINTADQLIAGMHIASSLLKDLRIVKIDASLVDKSNFEKALQWANDNDIEMFIELVDRESTQLNIEVV